MGLWVRAHATVKNMGSMGDSDAEKRGSFEPYIRVTSRMGLPPPPPVTIRGVSNFFGQPVSRAGNK